MQSSPYSKASDVYSFGLVLWELLSHERPYQGKSPLAIVRAKEAGETPEIPSGTHKDYRRLILDCWQKPRKRPTFSEV